jgi:hypothetical protein
MARNKHITEPDALGYQVRIVRQGKEKSRYFSHKLWGGKGKSLAAAIAWRDQMLVVLKGGNLRYRLPSPPARKVTTGLTGVSRVVKYARHKNKHYLEHAIDNGLPFHETAFAGWKGRRVYEDVNPYDPGATPG